MLKVILLFLSNFKFYRKKVIFFLPTYYNILSPFFCVIFKPNLIFPTLSCLPNYYTIYVHFERNIIGLQKKKKKIK